MNSHSNTFTQQLLKQIEDGNASECQKLIEAKADVNEPLGGSNAFHRAVLAGSMEIISLLYHAGRANLMQPTESWYSEDPGLCVSNHLNLK